MKILILGGTGMLGHSLFYNLYKEMPENVYATVRSDKSFNLFPEELRKNIISDVDATSISSLSKVISYNRPDLIINAIGLIRQLPEGQKALSCIDINARLPHLIYEEAQKIGARVIHYSTDCVFDGKKGSPYKENDLPTAKDLYGITKYLGELIYPNSLTIRTSIIGHELRNNLSLIEWFLAETKEVKGFRRAIYSGLPTTEHANILIKYILNNKSLQGLYHVSSEPISKYDLLKLVGKEYDRKIEIIPDDRVSEDKRLCSNKFHQATGYTPPAWPDLIKDMKDKFLSWQDFF